MDFYKLIAKIIHYSLTEMQMGLNRGSGGYWNVRVRTDRKGCKHQSYGRWQVGILLVAPTERKMMTVATKMVIGSEG